MLSGTKQQLVLTHCEGKEVTEGNLGFPLFVGGEARAEGERRP